MITIKKEILEEIVAKSLNELKKAEELSFENIDEVTEKIQIYDYGIIYFIFSNDELKYIGKSKGKYFRSRMKSHFFRIGKGTNSKNDFINKERKNNKVTLKYIKTEPESLRNLIEEMLIEKFRSDKTWNYK